MPELDDKLEHKWVAGLDLGKCSNPTTPPTPCFTARAGHRQRVA